MPVARPREKQLFPHLRNSCCPYRHLFINPVTSTTKKPLHLKSTIHNRMYFLTYIPT